MRRNRVLILFAVVFAVSTAVFWLGAVLADVAVEVNNELTVNVGDSGIIDGSLLQADDPDTTDETIIYTLVTTPANGLLVLTSTATTLTPDSQFTQLDIDSNFLVYTHDGTATIADSFNFTVTANATITDDTFLITINQPPEVLDQVFNVDENSAAGTAVDTIVSSDLNTSDTFTYTILDGNLDTAFEVGSSDGGITVANAAPLDFETNQNITFTVEVVDMGALTDTAVITVTINDINEAPVLDDFTIPDLLPEDSGTDDVVGTVPTPTDPDAGETFTYTITGGNPGPTFNIDPDTGIITVASTADLDFETTPTYNLTVQVEDSGGATGNPLTDTATITVNLDDVNEAPTVDPATFDVDEDEADGADVGTPVTATDPEDDDLTFSITAGDPDGVFDIHPDTGQITIFDSTFLDFEAQEEFSLTVQVVENATTDAFTDTATVEINITDVNEAPSLNADPFTFTVAENSPNDTTEVGTVTASDPENDALTFSIAAGDPDNVFAIDPDTGVITVADNSFLDYEAFGAEPHFSLTVQVVENATTDAFTDTATVEINITDVNETPTVNDNSFSINENSSNTTVVGTVIASDPDMDDEDALTFGILTGNTGGAFAISNSNDGNNNGIITVADSNQLDYETTQSFMLGIIVTDTGGLNNTANVTININNLFDEAPTVNNATFTVSEDSNNGVVVGTVTATDPEFASGDELTFSIIGGNTGTVFAINSSSGQITVPDASKLDADAMPTFNLTVQATDKGGKIDTGTITINVSPLPITFIYLPVMLNNYPPVEPNNNCAQSYGIGPATDYEFTADDTEDWYTVTLTSSANLSIILSSFEPAQGQLIVYGGSCGNLMLLGNNGNPNTTEKTLHLGIRPAGKYYIRVYSEPVTNTNYTLRVNIN